MSDLCIIAYPEKKIKGIFKKNCFFQKTLVIFSKVCYTYNKNAQRNTGIIQRRDIIWVFSKAEPEK